MLGLVEIVVQLRTDGTIGVDSPPKGLGFECLFAVTWTLGFEDMLIEYPAENISLSGSASLTQ